MQIYDHTFRPHLAQDQILKNRNRFNVIKCGRRFGKTELSKALATDHLWNESPEFVAYFAPTYRDTEKWWAEICRGSVRDQLSLPYTLGTIAKYAKVDWKWYPYENDYFKANPHVKS